MTMTSNTLIKYSSLRSRHSTVIEKNIKLEKIPLDSALLQN